MIENQVTVFENRSDLTSSGREYLMYLACPVLALYGHEDDRVPPLKSARQVKEMVSYENVFVINYPGSNHSLMQSGNKILPHLFNTQINWVKL